jgi:hypothetical protein
MIFTATSSPVLRFLLKSYLAFAQLKRESGCTYCKETVNQPLENSSKGAFADEFEKVIWGRFVSTSTCSLFDNFLHFPRLLHLLEFCANRSRWRQKAVVHGHDCFHLRRKSFLGSGGHFSQEYAARLLLRGMYKMVEWSAKVAI